MAPSPIDGILVIDKPLGPTSFDVVRRVRTLLKVKKAGHTGTLDPLATGVLPICLGEATKLAGFITEGDKTYDALIRLGEETDTQDAGGKVVQRREVPPLTEALLESALDRFRGTFDQLPPMYSAIKVQGKRLYEHARRGEEIERKPRSVTVHQLLLRDFAAAEVALRVRASKGFFVRTLAADLGQALGCGGHLKALRRTQSGPFSLTHAISLDRLGERVAELDEPGRAVSGHLMPLSEALAELPAWKVGPADAERVLHGVPLEVALSPGRVRVLSPAGGLLAVAEVVAGRLKYLRVLRGS